MLSSGTFASLGSGSVRSSPCCSAREAESCSCTRPPIACVMLTSSDEVMFHSRVDEAPHDVRAVREKFDTVRECFVQLVLVEDFLNAIEPKRREV
jgi:hypothetical protein